MRASLLLSVIALFAVGAAAPRGTAIPRPRMPPPAADAKVQGMTISCQRAGQIWGTDAMVETMADLKALGVNWIAIHPYAGIRPDGTVGGSRIDSLYADPSWLTRPIEEAHRLGLKIMIKPHIAYWGSPFSWRGEITFDTEAEWARFFSTYQDWITMVAELSAGADAFVVGTELGGTVAREGEWRRVIAAVRAKTDVPLTYSANWDRYEAVPFWDAVDVVGIQAYFPVAGHCELPEPDELDAAWGELIDRLDAFARRLDKKILMAELGYNRSSEAACKPWEYRTGGPEAEETQRRCMAAALQALERSDRIVGAFLWKWFAERGGRSGRGNFLMTTPAMRQVIADHWRDDLPPATP